MSTTFVTEDDHRTRSEYVRGLVQSLDVGDRASARPDSKPPKRIVQFWNDLDSLPSDVGDCIRSWGPLKEHGLELTLFDHDQAQGFIGQRLGERHLRAYGRCYHPAMQADYFRLCYLLIEGGCYVDADDVHSGEPIQHLFDDGRLKLQPLCYDTSTGEMVPPRIFTIPGANDENWIFYFNNNPLIAMPGHPIIEQALVTATFMLERQSSELLEIQSTTGPGNLTKAVLDYSKQNGDVAEMILILRDWENVATSKWPLSYRYDARNWRLSNKQQYLTSASGGLDGGQL